MTETGAVPFEVHEVQRQRQPIQGVQRPRSLRSALLALAKTPGSRPIAGGTDLLLDLQRSGESDPVSLIDLTGIAGFRAIIEDDDEIVLSGGVTHRQVVADDLFRESLLPLAQACLEIGSPQLRNRATLAGNIATASPANDSISALMALDARIELSTLDKRNGVQTRRVPIRKFFPGFRQTIIEPGELISSITLRKLSSQRRGMWFKLGLRRAQAISVVHGGVVLEFDGDTIAGAHLALGSVAPTVVMIDAFSEALVGQPLNPESIRDAAAAAAGSISPIDDGRATADYRRDALAPILERTLAAIAAGTESSMWPDSPPRLSTRFDAVSPSRRSLITDQTEIEVTVNGSPVRADGSASRTLLEWIRTSGQGLTGVKEGCAEGECGACTVMLDGSAVMSCLVSAAQAEAGEVTTVEGLADGEQLHPLQQSFVDEFAAQCGFCIPGFLVAGSALLDELPDPSVEQIRLALSGNLCRCTGYYPITTAVQVAGKGDDQ